MENIKKIPDIREKTLEKARSALQNNEFEKAQNLLENLLDEYPNDKDTISELSNLYLETNNTPALDKIWLEFDFSDITDEYLEAYLAACSKITNTNSTLLTLYQLKNSDNISSEYNENITGLIQTIEENRSKELELKNWLKLSQDELENKLSSCSKEDISNMLSSSLKLDNNDKITLYEKLIKSPNINQFQRYRLLELLVEVGNNFKLEYLGVDGLYSINKDTYIPLNETKTAINLIKLTRDYSSKYSPNMEEEFVNYIYQQLIYFYPDLLIIEDDINNWLLLNVENLQLPLPENTKAIRDNKQEEYLAKFNQALFQINN